MYNLSLSLYIYIYIYTCTYDYIIHHYKLLPPLASGFSKVDAMSAPSTAAMRSVPRAPLRVRADPLIISIAIDISSSSKIICSAETRVALSAHRVASRRVPAAPHRALCVRLPCWPD